MSRAFAGIPVSLVQPILDREASFTLDQKVFVESEFGDEGKVSVSAPNHLKKQVVATARNVLTKYKCSDSISIVCELEDPGSFPGEIEAACVATAVSLIGSIANKNGSVNQLRLDKYFKDQFFIVDGTIIKKKQILDLSIHDGLSTSKAAAAFYGGFAITRDNEIVRSGEMEELNAKVCKKSEKKQGRPQIPESTLNIAWNEAYRGNLYSAMNLSFPNPPLKLTKTGRDEKLLGYAEDGKNNIGLIRSKKRHDGIKTLNEPSQVIEKPKRIYKVKDFMKLDGSKGYNILPD